MLIAHITDTHISHAGRQARDLGATIAQLNALSPRPDVVLLSGDAANSGGAEQYRTLRDLLAGCAADVFVVPGNHDRRATLRAVLPERHFPGVIGEPFMYAIDAYPVRIIAIDTTAPGRPGGILDPQRLAWLDDVLTAGLGRPTLLFMHHPPFRTGVNLADAFGFKGLRRFREIVARHPHVRRIIAGHIHCERQTCIAGTLVSTGISTTPQRVPELFERHIVGLRSEPAGFTLHAWRPDGFATTTYVQTGDGRFTPR